MPRFHALVSSTSVMLLQILLDAGFADTGIIGVTQPRRVVSVLAVPVG